MVFLLLAGASTYLVRSIIGMPPGGNCGRINKHFFIEYALYIGTTEPWRCVCRNNDT